MLGFHCYSWASRHCSAWASHCVDFSCCREQALGTWALVVVALELSSCNSQALALWHVESSWTRNLNTRPLYWQADSYSPYHQGNLISVSIDLISCKQ